MISPFEVLPRAAKKIVEINTSEVEQCTLFEKFSPMPGGQTEFWDIVPFASIEDIDPRWLWFRGGIGAGKSMTGAAFVCTRAKLDPESRGLITANSYPQLTTSTLIALVEFCDYFNVPLSPRASTTEETAKAIARARLCKIFDASLLVISAEAFAGTTANAKETGRGLQVRYVWADEYAYADRSVFETINGRLGRGKGKIKGLGVITSSINRNAPYNYAYNTFVSEERSKDQQKLFVSVNAATADNKSLDADYVPSLESSYTPEMIMLELQGIFASSKEGRIFNHFDRNIHLAPLSFDPMHPLHLSFDFNRSPATCVIGQVIGNALHILEEIYLLNSDTFSLGEEARKRCDRLAPYLIYVHGDATGRMMTANSQQSNWDIIGSCLTGLPLNWQVGTINPPVADTINAANALLYHNRIKINDRLCPELIKDCETVKFDRNGSIDKKSDLMRTHLIDGFRYLVFDTFPLQQQGDRSAIVGGKIKTVNW